MLDALLAWDEDLFRLVNGQWQALTLDTLLPFITDWANFQIPLAVIAVVVFVLGGMRARRFVLLALMTVVVADAVSTYAVKYPVWRPRPCNALEGVRLLVGCTNSPSFPSNHAVNITAVATLVGLMARPLLMPVVSLTVLVLYSRIYVGVHYPLDVMAGAVLGIIVALLVFWGITTLLRAMDFRQNASPHARRCMHLCGINAL